jgi:hypothetical protein
VTAPRACIRRSQEVTAESLLDRFHRGAKQKMRQRGPSADEEKAAHDAAVEVLADLLEELDDQAEERVEFRAARRLDTIATNTWNAHTCAVLREAARELRAGRLR